MNIVFLVANCQFPYGSASSMRARNLYKLLEKTGHYVHVIADFGSESNIDDCALFSYSILNKNKIPFYKRSKIASLSIYALKQYSKKHKIDAVIMNAASDRFKAIVDFCCTNNYYLFIENCEWYHFDSFKLKLLDPRYWKNEFMIRSGFQNVDGFISISTFLDEHNKSFGKPSVRVPTILDVKNTPYVVSSNNQQKIIVYTGNPGKSKECLRPVIQALAENYDLRKRIVFHIYGPDRKAVLANISGCAGLLHSAGESVVLHGKVPQEQIQKVLMQADFLIFIRPDRKSSNAGFPTKLGESFAVGTPVIANDTGDISLYLHDRQNGYILCSTSAQEVAGTFKRVLDMREDENQKMRENARKTAEENFDYRLYKPSFEMLFNQAMR